MASFDEEWDPVPPRPEATAGPRLSEAMAAQLERLDRLHRAGALGADEYIAARCRVIEQDA